MVKKLLSALVVIIFINSCGFFGDTTFPTALSEEFEFLYSDDVRDFYILDKGGNFDLLVVVIRDNDGNDGTNQVAIFDTSLNLRGYLGDSDTGIVTDGKGFVDQKGNFVIGQTVLTSLGTSDPGDVGFVNVPDMGNNTAVIPYTDEGTSTDYYIRVEKGGNVFLYDDIWTTPEIGQQQISSFSDTKILNQNNRYFSDVVFAKMNGDVFIYEKSELYEHIVTAPFDLITPTFSISNTNLSGYVTRCSRGYFVSTYNGEFILYGNGGNEIDRIKKEDYYGQAVTIDHDCEYYYYINRDRGFIVKERLLF